MHLEPGVVGTPITLAPRKATDWQATRAGEQSYFTFYLGTDFHCLNSFSLLCVEAELIIAHTCEARSTGDQEYPGGMEHLRNTLRACSAGGERCSNPESMGEHRLTKQASQQKDVVWQMYQ